MAGPYPDPTPLVERAHHLLAEAGKRSLILRLVGALAFNLHCPNYNYIQKESKRLFTDVDFAAYAAQKIAVERMFTELGYLDDLRVKTIPGVRRSIFFAPSQAWHSDVFYDSLDFSHEINLQGRLKIDYPTISLADLLLEKMQIVRLSEKDVIDTLMLLREHEVGSHDRETINIDYCAQLCKADWGLWKTITTNLDKVDRLADQYAVLSADDRQVIRDRLKRIAARMAAEPSTLRWRLRSRVGERIKWYRDVDEVL